MHICIDKASANSSPVDGVAVEDVTNINDSNGSPKVAAEDKITENIADKDSPVIVSAVVDRTDDGTDVNAEEDDTVTIAATDTANVVDNDKPAVSKSDAEANDSTLIGGSVDDGTDVNEEDDQGVALAVDDGMDVNGEEDESVAPAVDETDVNGEEDESVAPVVDDGTDVNGEEDESVAPVVDDGTDVNGEEDEKESVGGSVRVRVVEAENLVAVGKISVAYSNHTSDDNTDVEENRMQMFDKKEWLKQKQRIHKKC